MTDWVSNVEVSVPLKAPADANIAADFNGVLFSWEYGYVYDPPAPMLPWKTPPPPALGQYE